MAVTALWMVMVTLVVLLIAKKVVVVVVDEPIIEVSLMVMVMVVRQVGLHMPLPKEPRWKPTTTPFTKCVVVAVAMLPSQVPQ